MNTPKPLISVVMPVYNAEPYLKVAIESILHQTCENLEFILVDDASTDNSMQIIEGFSDPRIKVLKNAENRGNVYSRNRGISSMTGEFYAPFDADDIARKDKLEKQLTFLQNHQEYGMIGSWAKLIDENNKELPQKWKLDASPKRIPSILLFRNYFVQSSILIRKEAIPPNGYMQRLITGSDYNMWIEISKKYETWNYPAYLVQYRIHDKGITQKYSKIVPETGCYFIYPSLPINGY
ncbi:MAG: glycosyltransferase family A protein [Bacteroidales bacterium]|nr:glycosyltransferase family A protein [Bacteroidales bacterium]